MRWYFDVLANNYLNFNGRARRKEFWMYTLVHLVILLLTGLIGMWPFTIYFVLTVIPSVGVGITDDFSSLGLILSLEFL